MQATLDQKHKCQQCNQRAGLELNYDAPRKKDVVKLRQGLEVLGGIRPKKGPVYKWRCRSLWAFVGYK